MKSLKSLVLVLFLSVFASSTVDAVWIARLWNRKNKSIDTVSDPDTRRVGTSTDLSRYSRTSALNDRRILASNDRCIPTGRPSVLSRLKSWFGFNKPEIVVEQDYVVRALEQIDRDTVSRRSEIESKINILKQKIEKLKEEKSNLDFILSLELPEQQQLNYALQISEIESKVREIEDSIEELNLENTKFESLRIPIIESPENLVPEENFEGFGFEQITVVEQPLKPVGLRNGRSICYANATFQVMFAIPEIGDWLEDRLEYLFQNGETRDGEIRFVTDFQELYNFYIGRVRSRSEETDQEHSLRYNVIKKVLSNYDYQGGFGSFHEQHPFMANLILLLDSSLSEIPNWNHPEIINIFLRKFNLFVAKNDNSFARIISSPGHYRSSVTVGGVEFLLNDSIVDKNELSYGTVNSGKPVVTLAISTTPEQYTSDQLNRAIERLNRIRIETIHILNLMFKGQSALDHIDSALYGYVERMVRSRYEGIFNKFLSSDEIMKLAKKIAQNL